MRIGGLKAVLIIGILGAAAGSLSAAGNYRVLNGPKDFYFGHISYVEPTPGGTDPVVLRPGRAEPERAVLNLPIGPGDSVRTSADRRCEIQFDSGTIVRLDVATEVRVQTILARSLSTSEEISALALDKGRLYIMYKQYSGREMFQVLTPNAAVKMKHKSVVLLSAAADGTTETQVAAGQARVLFGPEAARLDDHKVGKGQRLIVRPDDQSQLASAIEDTPFELWNKDINVRFEALHEGLSALPKPVQNLPPAVFYFAQTYGDRYGEWLWDDLYGYVWRPFIDNGRYPWGWRPYYYGQWSYAGGQMFWVPQEPWGWVPYHLGIWQWDKKLGWVWMPGSLFAPAWVTWDFFFGYAAWRPWSLYDCMAGDPYMYGSDPFWISYFRYTEGAWQYNWPYPWVPGGQGMDGQPALVRNIIRKDALKQPPAGSLPVPAELKASIKNVIAAYENGNARVRESAAAVPKQLVFVPKEDLKAASISEKAVTWDKVPKPAAPAPSRSAPVRISDPRREAARIFRGLDGPATAPRRAPGPAMSPAATGAALPSGPAGGTGAPVSRPAWAAEAPARFRDWNPDLKLARELGVGIVYSSMQNEIRCPELGLSSRDREKPTALAPRLTPRGVESGPGGFGSSGAVVSGGSSSSSSAGSSSSPTSARPSSERSSSGSAAKGAASGGGSGKIKN
jgi:hypothetical protein